MRVPWIPIVGLLTILVFVLLGAFPGRAQSVNLITAIDASHSITRAQERLQREGLARGLTDERFLQNLGDGVGFTAFSWSSDQDLVVLVPWTVIRTELEARTVAAQLAGTGTARNEHGFPQYPMRSERFVARGGYTNLSEAMLFALELASQAPTAGRVAINVISDGPPNTGADPSLVRDQAEALGYTINAVILPTGQPLTGTERYFRERVVTGLGAFVDVAHNLEAWAPILERKFWQDVISLR